jgi:hypothetical protein
MRLVSTALVMMTLALMLLALMLLGPANAKSHDIRTKCRRYLFDRAKHAAVFNRQRSSELGSEDARGER